ncbi:cytochrome P450 [Dactylonectria estremocensis]|uniref:Cytochrome P450 n=1 Tax=Dactylonectria estremocensis TaxID=1079267 RepID=A0A9P9FAX3_9HYPO|nr:cytochrome P450 [Dactylonectria estremocensis]
MIFFAQGGILMLIVCGAIVTTIFALYRSYVRTRNGPLPKIPYNHKAISRFLGDVPDIKSAKYRRPWIWSQPKTHGSPIAQLFLNPFEQPSVVVSDYREVVDICARRLKEFDRGTRNKECVGLTAPNFHMTMESRDPRFRVHKELLRDLMTPAFLNEVSAPRLYERTATLIELWMLKIDKGRGMPFSAIDDLFLAALDIVSSVTFGLDDDRATLQKETSHLRQLDCIKTSEVNGAVDFPRAPTDPETDSLFDLADMIAVAQRSPFPWWSQHLALLKPKHAKAWWYRRRLIYRQTTRSVKRLKDGRGLTHECALDQLLWREMNAAKKADRQPDFYSPIIRDELIGYLLGGHDTTATALAWWVKYMSSQQRVQHHLRSELRQAHSRAVKEARWPTIKEITSTAIPYLDAVMEETVRCAQIATLIVRTATCDTQILGYPIPKGVNVILPLTGPSMTEPALDIPEHTRSTASQRDKDRVPAWGDDIGEFIPERWLKWDCGAEGIPTQVFCPNAGPNLAFSTGPRQCFGKRLAHMEMRVLMTLLIWNFEFGELDEQLNSDEIVERLVNIPKDCYVKLTRTH